MSFGCFKFVAVIHCHHDNFIPTIDVAIQAAATAATTPETAAPTTAAAIAAATTTIMSTTVKASNRLDTTECNKNNRAITCDFFLQQNCQYHQQLENFKNAAAAAATYLTINTAAEPATITTAEPATLTTTATQTTP